MTKKLNDILKGVKSSKTETPNLKDIYNWEGGKSGEDFIKKHKIEKHEDRVGNDDEVYKGKTKPAKYPRQSDSVYEARGFGFSPNEYGFNSNKSKKRKKAFQDGGDFYDELTGNKVASYGKNVVKNDHDIEGAKKAREHFNKNHETHFCEESEVTEADCSCSDSKTSCDVHGKKKKMLLDKDMKESVTPRNKESNPFSTTTGSNNAKETTPKSETATTPKKSLKEIFKLDEARDKFRTALAYDKEGKMTGGISVRSNRQALKLLKRTHPDKKERVTVKLFKGETPSPTDSGRISKSKLAKEDVEINEVAPPNPKIEKWIKSNKDNFIKEYGRKKGMEVLYAKAWKMHNEQSGSPATNTDYAGPGAAGWTTGRMDTGTL